MKSKIILTLFLAFVAFSMFMSYNSKDSVGQATGIIPISSLRSIPSTTPPILPPGAIVSNGSSNRTARLRPGARPLGPSTPYGTYSHCTDSDGGNNPIVRGTVLAGVGAPRTDYCHSGGRQMYEYYCQGGINGTVVYYYVYRQNYFCPTACGGTPYCY